MVEQQAREVISEYTDREGGRWKRWPGLYNFIPANATLLFLVAEAKKSCSGTVTVNHRIVHSFRTTLNRRWDCINGWTHEQDWLGTP